MHCSFLEIASRCFICCTKFTSLNVTDQLVSFDKTLKRTSSVANNVDLEDRRWKLVTLPINIGLAISIDTTFPAYAACLTAYYELVGRILSNLSESDLSSMQEDVFQRWAATGFDLVALHKSQRSWTRIAAASKLSEVMSTLRPKRLVRVTAASQPHSGDWLKTIPVGQVGSRLDDDPLSISVLLDMASKFASLIYAAAVR